MLDLYFVMTVLLSLKADGRFPFAALGDGSYRILILIYTIIFVGCFAMLAVRSQKHNSRDSRHVAGRFCIYIAISQLMYLALIPLEARKYASFGYTLDPYLYGGLILLSLIGIIYLFNTKKILYVGFFLYIFGQVLSILSFPLNPERSDMLPLMVNALNRFFLRGIEPGSPYGLYDVGHTLPLTYLPGLWLSYFPVGIIDFDIRWMNLVYISLSLIIMLSIRASSNVGVIFLAIFLVTPYLQYRHEIYVSPILFWISVFVWYLNKGVLRCMVVAFAFLLLLTQLFWPTLPVFAVYIFKRHGLAKSVYISVLLVGVTASFFLLFMIPELMRFAGSQDTIITASALIDLVQSTWFFKGVVLHWKNVISLDAMNLGFFLYERWGVGAMILVQALFIFVISIYAIRKEGIDNASLLLYMTSIIMGFVLFNRLVWSYFYLVILFLIACYFFLRVEGRERKMPESYS